MYWIWRDVMLKQMDMNYLKLSDIPYR